MFRNQSWTFWIVRPVLLENVSNSLGFGYGQFLCFVYQILKIFLLSCFFLVLCFAVLVTVSSEAAEETLLLHSWGHLKIGWELLTTWIFAGVGEDGVETFNVSTASLK